MENEFLREIGLNDLQVEVYVYLLNMGPTSPPALTKALKITRTNAYKVLDQLVEMRIVKRMELQKKLVYEAEDPIALASIVAEERNRVIALEKNIQGALKQLRRTYQKSNAGSETQNYQGPVAIKSLYEHQASLSEPIYFIKTRADIPFMGYETMARIRKLPTAKHNTNRFGIIPDAPEAAVSPDINGRTNLTRTWMFSEDYTAPVEWTVSGDELMIIVFHDNGSGIRIKNPVVADAFKQLWTMLDKNLRANPEYKKHPVQAQRKI